MKFFYFLLLTLLFGTLNAATLLLEKTTDASTIQSGQEFTYTIRYTCQSTTDNCENVVLKDHLPPELDYVAHYDTADVGSSSFNATDANVTWTFTSVLAAGSTGELKLIAKFKEGTTVDGAVAHNIVVGPDGSASNDITASAMSRWTMQKRVIPEDADQPVDSVYLDRDTVYRVELCSPVNDNIGGLNLTNAVLVDTLPVDATFVSASDGGIYDGSRTVTWSLGDLTVTSGSTCYGANVVVRYSSSDVAENEVVTNVLSGSGTPVGSSSASFGPVTVDSTAKKYVFIAHPTPAIGKTAVASDSGSNWIRDDRLGNEQNITYAFDPRNNGNVELLDYNLTDDMPNEVEPYKITTGVYSQLGNVSLYIKDGSGWTLQGVYNRGTSQTVALASVVTAIAMDFGSVAPGFVPTTAPKLYVKVKDPGSLSTGDTIHNCADVNADDNASNALAVVQSCADITVRDNYGVPRLSKSNDSGGRPVAIGDTVTFTLRVENATAGTGPMDNPVVMDLLPKGLTYNGDQSWSDHDSGATDPTFEAIDDYNGTGRTLLRWTFSDGTTFARGHYGNLGFSVTVENTAGNGTVVNTGYITASTANNPISCGGSAYEQTGDPYDLDGDNNITTDVLCKRATAIDILDTTSLSSQKWVKGVLDADFTRYPNTGFTIGGGNADYKLIVKNNGNVPVRNLEVLDILPFEGDTGVTRPDENRSTKWRPNLSGPIDMGVFSSVSTVYYSVAGNPCRAADGYVSADTPDCQDPEWSTTPPGDISQVYSVKIVFDSSVVLDGNESLEFIWPMLAPVGSPIDQIAWNSFAFKAERIDGVSLLPAEPIKVGIEVKADENNSIGDRVWLDINHDGIQDSGEPGVNGVEMKLWDVSGSTPVEVSTPISSTDFNGEEGIYRFVHLPDNKDYRVTLTLPDGYLLSPADQGTSDQNDSDFGADLNATADVHFGINATPDENLTVDAGIYSTTKAAVGDYVWYESGTYNGVQDTGELPVVGMRVKLYYDVNNTLADVTTTNKQGRYLFYNLQPGNYYVQFDMPLGYVPIDKDVGGDDTVDSDANQSTFRTDSFTLNPGDVDLTRDMGIFKPASIGNYVWHDVDGDGVQDGSENGIGGVSVILTREADGATFTTTTEANGSYAFTLLHPGDYNLTFDWSAVDTNDHLYAVTLKDATSDTADSDGYLNLSDTQQAFTDTTTLDPDENDTTWDLGLYIPASLGDRVWLDYNGDGQQGVETGVAGVDVKLYDIDNGSALVGTDTTDGSGDYLFDNLRPGNYKVKFDTATLPAHHVFALQNRGDDATDSDADRVSGETAIETLISDEDNRTLDAGIYEPASLGNYIWYDADANGIQDVGEGNISNLPIELFFGGGSVYGDGVSTGLSMLTDSNGVYLFEDLRPDTYYIQVDLTGTDYMVTLLNIGSYDTDNDLDASGKSIDLSLSSGENNTSLDGGLFIPATLGNFVWEDMNRNGIQESGEPGISGVTMELLNAAGEVSQSKITDAFGHYQFDQIRPGDYQVRITVPSGYVQSPKDAAGSGDSNDSDFNTSQVTVQTHLDQNETDLSWDAGLYRYATLGNFVWEDTNANGIQDAGESGIQNVEVNLTRISDGAVFTTTTNASGEYLFRDLEPDEYNITFNWSDVVRDHAVLLTDKDATADNEDSDGIQDMVHSSQAYTTNIELVSNQIDLTWDLGLYVLASLGDKVWQDYNGNGLQDGTLDEYGIEGVTVRLFRADGTYLASDTTDASGLYLFDDLRPDRYYVDFNTTTNSAGRDLRITLKDQAVPDSLDSDAAGTGTSSGKTDQITLISDEDNRSWDAGVFEPASLGNFVWHDLNANGLQDPGEPALSNIGVTLNYDIAATGGTALPGSLITGSDGLYYFNGLRPDSYYVSFIDLTNQYDLTVQGDGSVAAVDSDPNTVTGDSTTVTLHSGEDDNNTDAGFYLPANVGDFIWLDANRNGIQDSGESGIGIPVTLKLHDKNGSVVDTTTSDPDTGAYLFEHIRPYTGNAYYIEVIVPSGYHIPIENAPGSSENNDSDLNASGFMGPIVLDENETDLRWDGGLYRYASIGDRVWLDTDANGIQNSGETGIGDVNVTLTRLSDGYHTWMLTDANGHYLFSNLEPDDYNITFDWSDVDDAQKPYQLSEANQGVNDAIDSDGLIDAGDSQRAYTLSATLVSNANDRSWDLGLYQLAAYGDRVWHDVNGNGEQDAMEPGIAGVKVTLYNDSNGTVVGSMDTNVSGEYRFTDLVPDDYHAVFDLGDSDLAGYVATLRDVNGIDLNDSDADRVSGATIATTLDSGEDDISWDLGVYQPASIGDLLFVDTDANGIQDDGAGGVDGINVSLYYDRNDSLVASTTTSGGGNYLFNNLRPDSYYIHFDLGSTDYLVTLLDMGGNEALDSDIVVTDNNNTAAYVLSSGEDNRSVDGGVYKYASLGDYVWDDLNANGLQDAGESGIGMVTVDLFDDSDNQIDTTTTENNGSYRFDNLVPGTYYVQFDLATLPVGYVVTERNASNDSNDTLDSDANPVSGSTHRVTLSSGEHNPTLDMGAWKPASLGNYVWTDTDADGTQNESSTGLADVNVTAYHNDGTYAGSDVTAADGSYLIDNLKPGSYYIEFNLSSQVLVDGGYRVSTPNAGSDDALDSDANVSDGRTQTVTLISGDYIPTLDMGVYQPAAYGDRVWHDVNGNGEQDAMEPGIAGVKVTLYNDSNGTVVGSMDTNVSGEYRFTDLVPDDYHAVFDLGDSDLAGYVATLRDVNGIDLNDSDADRVSGATIATTLDSGEDDISWDLGVYQPASIGDYVWYDSDADGIQDGTEVGVTDINVSLYDGSGTLIASQLTDGSGNYLFDSLRPDDYYVGIDVSGTDYLITLLDQGGDDTMDSDIVSADRKTGSTVVTALSDGEDNRSLDAGLYQLASLGDYVWDDLDEDGIQDTGEPGVDDVTINLFMANGTFLGSTVTTGGGYYEFTDLEPGGYYVEIDKATLPEDYGLAFANRGGDESKDSDANVTTGKTGTITLLGGDDYSDLDFGILKKRLDLQIRSYCQNDAPYVEYNITLIGLEAGDLNATMTWSSPDGSMQYVEDNLPLSDAAHLWYGAGLDGSGVGNQWPGWLLAADGTWDPVYSDWLRWSPDRNVADVNISLFVDPETSVSVNYPPATALCNPNPPQYVHVFDPPSAKKTFDNEGWPEVEWKMVWINDGNAIANRVHIVDPIEANLSFVDGSLECNVTGASVTENCEYDSGLNAVVWDGAIAPDPGAIDEESALNEVVIVFRTSVENNATEVFNQARAYWDQDGDGTVDMNRSVPSDDPETSPEGDPTIAKVPVTVPTVSEWGRMAMIAIFLASAYVMLYRRREEA